MKKLPLGSLALIAVVAGPAMAADLRVKAPVYKAPPPVVAYNWSGCYVGGNLGAVYGDPRLDVYPSGRFFTDGTSAADRAVVSNTYSLKDTELTGGAQAGCNKQWGSLLIGLEADLNFAHVDKTLVTRYPLLPTPSGGSWSNRAETLSHSLHWLSTVRARLGYAFDRWLVYATGGVAFARVESSLDVLFPSPIAHYVGAGSSRRTGWTAGGGLEHAFGGNWTGKAEYLYADLGTFTAVAPLVSTPAYTFSADVKTRLHIFRVGLNYKFDWVDPVVARY